MLVVLTTLQRKNVQDTTQKMELCGRTSTKLQPTEKKPITKPVNRNMQGFPLAKSEYLRQNDCDEMHIILEQITPYLHESLRSGRWTVRSDYLWRLYPVYRPSHIIFINRSHTGGGHALRQGFLSMEPLIVEERVWGLERIMYAVNGLAASRYIDIVKLLLILSGNLPPPNLKCYILWPKC